MVYTFTYNRRGEPLTVKHPGVGTGNPNAYRGGARDAVVDSGRILVTYGRR